MFRNQYQFFEQDGVVGQVSYPFRIGGTSLFRTMLQVVAKPMASIMTFGFFPVGLLLFGVNLVPGGLQNGYALVTGLMVIGSVPLSWTLKFQSVYCSKPETFEVTISVAGRKFKSWVWPKRLFKGISYGSKGLERGMTSVVRLKCEVDGYLVDSFFHANSAPEAKELAQRLSEVSGLPVLGEEFTGQQHRLNDLRHHEWLTGKHGRQNRE